jgi:hypothetical protein
MRLASARLFAARALMGLVDRLVGPPEVVPQPVTDEGAPVCPIPAPTAPQAGHDEGHDDEGERCPHCALTIGTIGDAFAGRAYDPDSAPFALRSLSLLGFGSTLPTCPFHTMRTAPNG